MSDRSALDAPTVAPNNQITLGATLTDTRAVLHELRASKFNLEREGRRLDPSDLAILDHDPGSYFQFLARIDGVETLCLSATVVNSGYRRLFLFQNGRLMSVRPYPSRPLRREVVDGLPVAVIASLDPHEVLERPAMSQAEIDEMVLLALRKGGDRTASHRAGEPNPVFLLPILMAPLMEGRVAADLTDGYAQAARYDGSRLSLDQSVEELVGVMGPPESIEASERGLLYQFGRRHEGDAHYMLAVEMVDGKVVAAFADLFIALPSNDRSISHGHDR